MIRNGYETELLAAKVAVEAAKENRFVTELEDKSSQVEKNKNVIFFMFFYGNKFSVGQVNIAVAKDLDLFQNLFSYFIKMAILGCLR